MNDLPQDVLALILGGCDIRDYVNFSLVCRRWCDTLKVDEPSQMKVQIIKEHLGDYGDVLFYEDAWEACLDATKYGFFDLVEMIIRLADGDDEISGMPYDASIRYYELAGTAARYGHLDFLRRLYEHDYKHEYWYTAHTMSKSVCEELIENSWSESIFRFAISRAERSDLRHIADLALTYDMPWVVPLVYAGNDEQFQIDQPKFSFRSDIAIADVKRETAKIEAAADRKRSWMRAELKARDQVRQEKKRRFFVRAGWIKE